MDQRYYASAYGRFNTVDPLQSSATPNNPVSWNRYAYVGGDPVNLLDPRGMEASGCGPDWIGDPSLSGPCCPPGGDSFLPDPSASAACYSTSGIEEDGAAGGNSAPPPPQCPKNIQNFFNIMIPIATSLATSLSTSANDILALSSLESGWLDAHNQALHNPFGLTNAGGPNINFTGGYQAAADFWQKNDGSYVEGIFDIAQFATSLQPHYNTVNPSWTSGVIKQLKSVEKWRAICGD